MLDSGHLPDRASSVDDLQFVLGPCVLGDDVRQLWGRLENGAAGSFFLSWAWVETWLRCLPGCIRPQLLTAERAGEVVGAAIVVIRRERRRGVLNVRQLHVHSTGDPALDCIWIEHNGFVGEAAAQRNVWPALLRWFDRQNEADELVVPRTGDATGPLGPRSSANLLYRAMTSPGFRTPLRPGGVDAILTRVSANTRQQLRRSLRCCEALGRLRCELAPTVDAALAWFAALKALHVETWQARGQAHAFRYPFWETFHRALIARGIPDGSVQLLRISAGGTPLGYLYNFQRGGTVYAYQSGFDYGRAELKPGYISHLLAMAKSAQDGATCYDFLAGDNRLKRSLASDRYAIVTHRFTKRTTALRIEAAARALHERLFGPNG